MTQPLHLKYETVADMLKFGQERPVGTRFTIAGTARFVRRENCPQGYGRYEALIEGEDWPK